MPEHDFRYALLDPTHTLTECRALAPGRFQVTGTGGSIRVGDTLLVTLKGSRSLSQRLLVDKIRYLINPPGQWIATASGPAFKALKILNGQVNCTACGKHLDFEFATDAALGQPAEKAAAAARITELGWSSGESQHHCPGCKERTA